MMPPRTRIRRAWYAMLPVLVLASGSAFVAMLAASVAAGNWMWLQFERWRENSFSPVLIEWVPTDINVECQGEKVPDIKWNREHPDSGAYVLTRTSARTMPAGPCVLVVAGTQAKARECRYISPIRAETQGGQHLVVTSRSRTSGQNWDADLRPRAFGPWVVEDAIGRSVRLYVEHSCRPEFATFSELGVIDATRVLP